MPGAQSTPTSLPPGEYSGVGAAELAAYRSTFELEFSGDPGWRYELALRRGLEATEWLVHIEGVEGTQNPGDVRAVAASGVTRVLGPGTLDQCLQYPSDLDINIRLLSPDDLIDGGDLTEPLVPLEVVEVAGVPATHYGLIQPEMGRWEDVQFGVWLDRQGESVLRLEMQASGWDSIFNTGFGDLDAIYQVVEIGPQIIEPIQGCQAAYPVPAEAERLVLLPQYIAFETAQSLDDLVAFYLSAMAEAGWQTLRQEARQSGSVFLQFRRGAETVQVSVSEDGELRRVELSGRG